MDWENSQNYTFLTKLAFQLVTKPDYKVSVICPLSIGRANWSDTRRSLIKVWNLFMDNTCWSIGEVRTVNFLTDNWIPCLGPLWNYVKISLVDFLELKVADLVELDGWWYWNSLRQYFDKEILKYVVAYPPPKDELGKDRCVWKNSATDRFSVRDVYITVWFNRESLVIQIIGRFVWGNNLSPRIKHFMRLALRQGFLMNQEGEATVIRW